MCSMPRFATSTKPFTYCMKHYLMYCLYGAAAKNAVPGTVYTSSEFWNFEYCIR
jgi:hypothetical protein